MANADLPGFHVVEVPPDPPAIAGVDTTSAVFVGRTSDGPTEPVAVVSLTEFERAFGSPDPDRELGHAVRAFFENGGARAWIVRVPEGEPLTAGLDALDAVGDACLLCLPGETDLGVLRPALEVAERRGLFVVLDAMDPDPKAVATAARELATEAGATNAALYWPAFRGTDATGSERLRAPSGAVVGMIARVAGTEGVWTAPAGDRASLAGVDGVAAEVSDAELVALADAGVNAIRAFPDGGVRVWGGRTLSSDPEWRYVNVRRFFLFLEHSLDRGLQWTVFEPNGEPLWKQVRATVTRFLGDLWRTGALQGQTPDDAFFVRCDRTTMTQDDLDEGRLHVVVGVAPARPAEFVVIDIRKNLAAVTTEVVGESTGEPGLEFLLPHGWTSRLAVMVEAERGWSTWTAVEDFSSSGATDEHYLVEIEGGVRALLRFGDGEHGAVPPKGARIRASYRYGAGQGGNAPSPPRSRSA